MVTAQLGTVVRHIRKLAAVQNHGDETDGALLRAFLGGNDQPAFETLMRRHGPMVLRVCRHTLGNVHDAEDALQATFLVLAQRAASIRKTDSLASWLHGVAYRMATHAKRAAQRRHTHESRVSPAPACDPAPSAALKELQVLLDLEIQRLPESLRAPFVLCCLENKTNGEVARQLGLKEATVGMRLSRARKVLQERLTRRGVSLTAVLAAVAVSANGASAALSPSLVGSTARAAAQMVAGDTLACGLVPAKVITLVKGVNQAMFLTKGQIAILLLLGTAIVGAGLGLTALRGAPAEGSPATKQATREAAREGSRTLRPQPADAPPTDARDLVKIHGHVLGPDGKPFKGAKVYFNPQEQDKPPVRATTGDDGRFAFQARGVELASHPRGGPATIVATANGCGADWAEVPAGAHRAFTLRLVKDDVPIKGRILTLEGHPVARAKVRVLFIRAYPGGDLKPLFKAMRERKTQGEYPVPRHWWHRFPNQPKEVVCDAAGRFRLWGVGRDRQVDLVVEAPRIHHWFITVCTRVMEPITPPNNPTAKHYGATFEHQALPGRTITGVVRELGTRKPLAGIPVGGHDTLSQGRTDADGRYQLPGVAKAGQYTVFATPSGAQAYFTATVVAPDTAGLGPLSVDLEMTRGIPFRGKVIDPKTGKPVPGHVSYYALHGNANAPPSEAQGGPALSHSAFAADGSFTCVVLPGPGVVAVAVATDRRDRYLAACVGPRELFKVFKVGTPERSPFGTRDYLMLPQDRMMGWHSLAQNNFQAIVPVNPNKDEKEIKRNVILKPASTLTGRVVGPDGKPLSGARIAGLKEGQAGRETLDGAGFTMMRPDPRRPRTLFVEHQARKLVGTLEVRGTEKGPIQVRLEPWAAVTGRLVTQAGPLAQITLNVRGPNNSLATAVRTDKEGRFRIEGLVPGVKYLAWVFDGRGFVEVWKNVTLKAGETKNLGKISLGRSARE